MGTVSLTKSSSAKSAFQARLHEKNVDSKAVDFFVQRNQLISARSEVEKLSAQLEAARGDVRRLEGQQARDKKESNELKQIDLQTAKSMKGVDQAAMAHLHSQHHKYTQIIGRVPHSALDMASRIMKDSFTRVEKEVIDDKL